MTLLLPTRRIFTTSILQVYTRISNRQGSQLSSIRVSWTLDWNPGIIDNVVLRQHSLQRGVLALDGLHRRVDKGPDLGLLCRPLELLPAGIGRNPEDVLGPVFIRVLRIGPLTPFQFQQLAMPSLEGIGDVLEEHESQDNMLVLGGVHVAAHLVGAAQSVASRFSGLKDLFFLFSQASTSPLLK